MIFNYLDDKLYTKVSIQFYLMDNYFFLVVKSFPGFHLN